jgi:hypothetical protein
VSTATDLQLAATPAFGNQRPDVPWLLQTLQRTWQQLVFEAGPASALALLDPVIAAAGSLLAQATGADHDGQTAAACSTAAAELLDTVCALLASSGSSNQGLPYTQVLTPVMLLLLPLLQQHPELPPLQHLQAALSVAVRAEAAAADGKVLDAAKGLQIAGNTQITGDVMARLYWAATEGAAAQASSSNSCRQLLLQNWHTAVTSFHNVTPSASAATAVVTATVEQTDAGDNLSQQLLSQPLPTAILGALVQAAVGTAVAEAVLPLLLAHALQHQQLESLPASLLPQLLQTSLAAAAAGGPITHTDYLQVLEVVLQQQDSKAVSASTAQLLIRAVSASTDSMRRFEALIQQHAGSRAASALMCLLLEHASTRETGTELSWQLFRLLEQHSKPSLQQLAACTALLVQQVKAGTPAATDRVLSVWQHCRLASATFGQLDTAAQQAVVSALVAQQQETEALSLVQQAPELLPHLASLWQQQQQQRGGAATNSALLLRALQLCVTAGDKPAADAAEMLAELLVEQQDVIAILQEGELCVQLVQLLCLHGMTATALQLLPVCLSTTAVTSAGLAGAVAAAAAAVRDSDSREQQQDLLQLLKGSSKQATVQSALSDALTKPGQAAAVGLLLDALQRSSPGQRLGQLLTSQQLEQLCRLVCDNAVSGSSSSGSGSSASVSALPAVNHFAQECLAAAALPAPIAAQLVGVLCKQHPELQPAVAAAHLEVVAAQSEQGHTADRTSLATAAVADPATLRQLVQTVASLCYSQVTGANSPAADLDALEASFAKWAAALSPDAAAAALFAAWWHRAQQPGAAVPLLCLELYQRAKSTGNSLVFDLGLVAAAEAAGLTGNWHRGMSWLLCSQVTSIWVQVGCQF